MKGQIIAVFLGIVIYFVLNTQTMSIFFKIKRQRLYKQKKVYDTSSNVINISEKVNSQDKNLSKYKKNFSELNIDEKFFSSDD